MIDVSVIIPTCNRPQYLNRTLSSLVAQITNVSFEVLVLDDYGQDDRARNIVKFWAKKKTIRYLNPVDYGMSRGRTRIRNLGIAQARGSILVFLDDDMIVSTSFIDEHFQSHMGTTSNVVLGYRHYVKLSYQFLEYINPVNIISDPMILESLPTVRDERESIYRTCHGEPNKLSAPWVLLYSNNCSVRRELLEKAGGAFNELFLGAWGGEDVELGYRLFKAGGNFVLNRRAVGYHQWHYVDWRKNISSLKTNLIKFFQTHPNIETELYLDYIETGLDQYLVDVVTYSNPSFDFPDSVWDSARVWNDLKVRLKLDEGERVLLVGAGHGFLLDQLSPAACSDIRVSFSEKWSRKKKATVWHRLLGTHLPCDNNAFDVVLINDFLTGLAPYHRKLVFKEALRLASKKVIFATSLKSLHQMLSEQTTMTTRDEMLARSVNELFGLSTFKNITASAEIIGDVVMFTIKKNGRVEIVRKCDPKRLIVIADAGMADAFCDNGVELTLALARQGFKMALQLEDYKTLELISVDALPHWDRYTDDEKKILQEAMRRDLRGEKHLYPQLSLTGQSHYHDTRIEWLRSKSIGVLSSPYVHALNDQVDSVWCPSDAFKESYVKSGGRPENVTLIPPGILPSLAERHRMKGKTIRPNGRFRFVCVGTIEKSDGIDLVLRAFCRTFRKNDKVDLLVRILPLKSRDVIGKAGHHNRSAQREHSKHVEQARALHRYRLEIWRRLAHDYKINPRRVKFQIAQEELRGWPELFSDADCYVQAHRVDPIGQRVLQAVGLGLPVIATARYLPAELSVTGMTYGIRSREIAATEGEWSSQVIYSRWAEPSIDHLVRTMKHVYVNRREARVRAEKAAAQILTQLSWTQIAQRVSRDLERLGGGKKTTIPASPLASLFSNLKKNGLINIEEEAYERR